MSESDDASKQELVEAEKPIIMVDPIQAPNSVSLLERALEKGVSSEQLQQFMDLQERYDDREASKAFSAAFVRCQKEMPAIHAKAWNDHTKSMYAKLQHVNAGITPIYTKHGFSVSFSEGKAEIPEYIRTVCVIRHKFGHSETHFVDMPLDLKGIKDGVNKTAIQAKKSSFQYACRTLVCMIFNLTVGDDVDGNAPEAEINYISKHRVEQLEEVINAQDDSFRPRVMEYLKGKGIDSLETIQAESFSACLRSIKSSAKIAEDLNNADT